MSNKIGPAFPFLFINLPTAIPTGYGVESTTGPYGIFISCRGLLRERELITKAARRIGISYGEFIRRTTVDAANYVLENIPEQ
jgi:hypothetical protein